jgi:hypothetical protein
LPFAYNVDLPVCIFGVTFVGFLWFVALIRVVCTPAVVFLVFVGMVYGFQLALDVPVVF